jgi:hypothetical protein
MRRFREAPQRSFQNSHRFYGSEPDLGCSSDFTISSDIASSP